MIRFALLLPVLFAAGTAALAAPPTGEGPFLKANDQAMAKMMADMNVKPTGDVDRDFARMMIPHHQGAIDMCRPLLRYGRNPELRTLCTNIIAAQTREIALMRRVLDKMGPAPKAGPMPAMGHMDHGM